MTGQSYVELEFGSLDRTAVTVSLSPMVSVLSLLSDAVRRRYTGMPKPLCRAAEAALAASNRGAIEPIVAPGHSIAPDTVVPIPPHADVPMREQLAYLRSASEDMLIADVQEAFGTSVPTHWRRVLDRPRQWLHAYAQSSANAWDIVAPLWRHLDGLMRKEVERVAMAATRGRLDVVLGNLSPKVTLRGSSLLLPDSQPTRIPVDGRPLVLLPMVAGNRSLVLNADRPDCVWIGYPLPTLESGLAPTRHAPAAESPLDIVLGRHRAAILRMAGRPRNMGEIANRLHYSPGNLTHHCDRLVKAGLVQRVRRGRETILTRTDRGTHLLDVLDADRQRLPGR